MGGSAHGVKISMNLGDCSGEGQEQPKSGRAEQKPSVPLPPPSLSTFKTFQTLDSVPCFSFQFDIYCNLFSLLI